MNKLFRDNYTLEEISAGTCVLCNNEMTCNAFGRWCSSTCKSCGLLVHHFVKEMNGYRLTDILWNMIPERRFWSGSDNNVLFTNSYPKLEFEIETFDRESLMRLDEYVKQVEVTRKKEEKTPMCEVCGKNTATTYDCDPYVLEINEERTEEIWYCDECYRDRLEAI